MNSSADVEERRAKGDRSWGLSLLAFCTFVTCVGVCSLACPLARFDHDLACAAAAVAVGGSGGRHSLLARPQAHLDSPSEATAAPPQLARAHGTRLDPRDTALPDRELRAIEPADSEQDASLDTPAVKLAGNAAPLPSTHANGRHVGCMAWALRPVVSTALARGPPRVSVHVEPSIADTRPATMYGRSGVLAA